MFENDKKDELKDYFLQCVDFLNKLKEFEDIFVTGEIMRNDKKDSYWATVQFVGSRRADKIRGYATIYLNMRDMETRGDISRAVAHEANHLKPASMEYYENMLKIV